MLPLLDLLRCLLVLIWACSTLPLAAQLSRCDHTPRTSLCTQRASQPPTSQPRTLEAHKASEEQRHAREWRRAEKRTAANARAHVPSTSICTTTSRRIDQLDAMARQGGSLQLMERVRAERQALRDQQFRSGC
jgi:hypothetical protein